MPLLSYYLCVTNSCLCSDKVTADRKVKRPKWMISEIQVTTEASKDINNTETASVRRSRRLDVSSSGPEFTALPLERKNKEYNYIRVVDPKPAIDEERKKKIVIHEGVRLGV